MASARTAARYNVRPLLPGPEGALRDTVLRLGVPVATLPSLARHGAIEALALDGLTPEQVGVLERAVRDGDGALLSSRERDRCVVLMPLLSAGMLPSLLVEWGESTADLGVAIGDALVARGVPPPPIDVRGHRLAFGARTLVAGIVNVTPDSFAGDGHGADADAAVRHAHRLVDDGADMVDIGGESTRPNSTPISAGEELSRVMPVLEALGAGFPVPISIDTRKAEVARAALDAGASIVNDVWGLRGDPEMAGVVATHPECAVIVMHNRRGTDYGDLLGDVCASLRESLAIADSAGIDTARVIIDPGFGFAKTPAQNLELVRRLGELRGMGRAILLGPSRKSTIGAFAGAAPSALRVDGGLALATLAVAAGAHVIRTHDMAATVRAMRAADAVVRGTPEHIAALPMPGPTG